MSRRLASAWACLLIAATTAQAQTPLSKDLIPTPTALSRLGLKRHWYGVVPLNGPERVSQVSVDRDFVFVQTDHGKFHAMNAETGQWLWSASLGTSSPISLGASSNSFAIYVSNSNEMFAFAKKTGQRLWKAALDDSASSPTAADDDHVFVGLITGKLSVFNAATGKRAWEVQTSGVLKSRPIPAGRVVAFASADGKVYISRSSFLQPLVRWSAVGPIVAPMGTSGARTLLVASEDKSLYSLDIYKGETNWTFASGAPIDIEPLVSSEDVYVVNKEGFFTRLDVKSGSPYWTISTLGGPLLAVTKTRVYLETRDGDLFIVDRNSGQMLADPRATHQRAGVNIREFEFGPTNRLNDRLYLGSKSGVIMCLREIDQVLPRPLREPSEKAIGYVPPEGYLDEKPLPPPANAEEPSLEPGPDGAKPTTPKADPAEKPEEEPK